MISFRDRYKETYQGTNKWPLEILSSEMRLPGNGGGWDIGREKHTFVMVVRIMYEWNV